MGNRVLRLILLLTMMTGGLTDKVFAVEPGFEQYRRTAQEDIEKYKKAVRENPLDADAYFKLGLVYMSLGRHREEIEAYKESIRIKPDFAVVHFNIALAYDSLKDGVNAIAHILEAQEIYAKQKNPRGMRRTSRRLRDFYGKYNYTPNDFKVID